MGVFQDLRFALRVLVRKPLFTAVVVFTLSLGIGAGSAMFSIVHALLLRPIDLPDLDRLAAIQVSEKGGEFDSSVSPRTFLDYLTETRSFDRLAAYQQWNTPLSGSGDPELVRAFQVSPGYFDLFGVRPLLGRWFAEDEVDGKQEKVVILSHALWDRRYGRDPAILGKSVVVAEESYVVVGVMPHDFDFPSGTDLWAPLTLLPSQRADRGSRYLGLVARLGAGVALDDANAEMRLVGERHAAAYREDGKRAVRAVSLVRGVTEDFTRNFVTVLLGAALLVLLIACANVANLFLAHALARRKELAVRAALGAGRRRIARQLLTEAALLGVAGAAGAVLLAGWVVDVIKGAMPHATVQRIPGWASMGVEPAVLLFALACGLVVGLIFGVFPALQASRTDVNSILKDSDRGSTGGAETHRLRNVLVVAQITIALVLLLGGGALVKGFARMAERPRGYDPDGVLSFKVALPQAREARRQEDIVAFARAALDGLRALPGVESVAAVNSVPFGRDSAGRVIFPEGRVVRREDEIGVDFHPATPGYLELLRVPRLEGRVLEERDGVDAPRVAVVSATAARRLWPGESPVGKRFRFGRAEDLPWVTVVGVVGDVDDRPFEPGPRAAVWVPFVQQAPVTMYFALRTPGDPLAMARAAAQVIYAVDADQPVTDVRTLDAVQGERLAGLRLGVLMMGGFAVLALILAAVGIYGVIATLVANRTHEIGVRMALGAQRGDVLRLVIQRGALLAAVGIAIGLVVGFMLVRLLAGVLVGAIEGSAPVFVVFTSLVAGIALLGSFIPAWRAAKLDPLVALRDG